MLLQHKFGSNQQRGAAKGLQSPAQVPLDCCNMETPVTQSISMRHMIIIPVPKITISGHLSSFGMSAAEFIQTTCVTNARSVGIRSHELLA